MPPKKKSRRDEEQCCRLRPCQEESQDGMCGLAKCREELVVQSADGAECSFGELSFLYYRTEWGEVCCTRYSICKFQDFVLRFWKSCDGNKMKSWGE
jgi:hypothetical protein